MNVNSLTYPERLHIELTSRCNFKCRTCRHGYEDYGVDMTESMVDFIIKRSVPYAKEIELEGTGESLMSPYFGKLFCAIKQAKTPQVMLITNGSLLSDTLLEKFLGTGIQLVFSVDGCNSEEYKKIRSAGNFNIIIENIKKTATLFNSHNSGESCVINMVLSKINLYSVKNMIDLAVNLGIDFLNISEIRPCMPSDAWNSLRIDNISSRKEFEAYINDCGNYAKAKKLGFKFNPYIRESTCKKNYCISPWKHLYLNTNGDISPCCIQPIIFGNICNDNFDEIWNGDKINQFRNEMLLGNYDSKCLTCCLSWGLPYE